MTTESQRLSLHTSQPNLNLLPIVEGCRHTLLCVATAALQFDVELSRVEAGRQDGRIRLPRR
jgi:hypothetical protein